MMIRHREWGIGIGNGESKLAEATAMPTLR
jgi:hypothetical protein